MTNMKKQEKEMNEEDLSDESAGSFFLTKNEQPQDN